MAAGRAALAARRERNVVRWAAHAGDDVLVGGAEDLPALLAAWGDRPMVAHDWKETSRATAPLLDDTSPPELFVGPAKLGHDTMVAAYLINPARRRYPLDELTDEAGIEVVVEGTDGMAGEVAGELAGEAAAVRALADFQTDEIERLGLVRLFEEVELPLVPGPAGWRPSA